MIDRENRDRLAFAMRQLASGRISNDEFDMVGEELMALRHTLQQCDCGYDTIGLTGGRCPECGRVCDPALSEIACWAWLFYSDLRTHSLRGDDALDREERHDFARAILFLKSDFEYRYGSAIKDSTVLGEGGRPAAIVACSLCFAALLLVIGLLWGPKWLVVVAGAQFLLLYGSGRALHWIMSARAGRRDATRSTRQRETIPTDVLRNRWPFSTEAELAAAREQRLFLCTAQPTS